jgi:hypothetical protein
MKTSLIVTALILLIPITYFLVQYLVQRTRQKRAESKGTVVYATLLSAEPVKFFGKPQGDTMKIVLRVQEPGETTAREVSLRTRVNPAQPLSIGARVPVAIDPKNPKRVYPASEEAAKRAVVTGSRLERRVMQQQLRTPGRGVPNQPAGYQPPPSVLRRR